LPPLPAPARIQQQDVWSQLTATISQWSSSKLFLMIPSNMAFGLMQGFHNGYFARFIVKETVGVNYLGYFFAMTAGAAAVISLPLGFISDRCGRRPCMLLGFFANTLVCGWLLSSLTYGHSWVSLSLTSILVGVGNAVWQTINSATFGAFFVDDMEAAFSNLKLWSGVATALSFYLFPLVPPTIQLVILLIFEILGIIGYLIAEIIYEKSLPPVTGYEEISGSIRLSQTSTSSTASRSSRSSRDRRREDEGLRSFAQPLQMPYSGSEL